MKINGVRIKERIAELILRRDTLATQFIRNLSVFPGDKFKPIIDVDHSLMEAEYRIAAVQAIQARYNTSVAVLVAEISSEPIALDVCINIVGAYGRAVNRWKDNARGGAKPDRYSYQRDVRNADEQRAVYQLEPDAAGECMMLYQRVLNRVRAAITIGNMTEIDISDDEYAELIAD